MKEVIFVAGGTGGHLLGSYALGHYMEKENSKVSYIAGDRPLDYSLMPLDKTYHLRVSPFLGKSPLSLLKAIMVNIREGLKVFIYLLKKRPAFVLGTGGYVCGPVLLAAFLQGIPVYLLEQNSVMGLTNKILRFLAKKVFTGILPTDSSQKLLFSGNPLRKELVEEYLRAAPQEEGPREKLKVLVFGGSLGAKEINDIVLFLYSEFTAFPLEIVHQCGVKQLESFREEMKRVSPGHQDHTHKAFSFIDEMGTYYRWADVIISRSGASTVSELLLFKKDVLFIPYPHHKDEHQLKNARFYEREVKGEASVMIGGGRDEIANYLLNLKEAIKKEEKKTFSSEKMYEQWKRPYQIIFDEILKRE
mgnify:CR=1 FL=1